MTVEALFAIVAVAIAVAVLWDELRDVADDSEPDLIAYLESDGEYVEVERPDGWRADDVHRALAWIQQLPEVAHA